MSNIRNYFKIVIVAVISSLFVFYFMSEKKIDYKVLNPIVDIGNVKINEEAKAIFTIINIGETPFIVDNVSSDCHCTIANWSKESVNPREEFKIEAKYDKSQLGYFEQTISIFIKDDNNPPPLLILRGRVLQ